MNTDKHGMVKNCAFKFDTGGFEELGAAFRAEAVDAFASDGKRVTVTAKVVNGLSPSADDYPQSASYEAAGGAICWGWERLELPDSGPAGYRRMDASGVYASIETRCASALQRHPSGDSRSTGDSLC